MKEAKDRGQPANQTPRPEKDDTKTTREQKIQTDVGRKVSGRPTGITNSPLLNVYVHSRDQHAETPADESEHKFARQFLGIHAVTIACVSSFAV